jgi:5-methylthioadenosine/S-adenosylhomocysteine deaminase
MIPQSRYTARPMKHCDTLISPRWCVPVRPSGQVLSEYAVIVTDGRITNLLPLAEARQKYQPSVTLDRPDHVLIPGLVNAHTHAAMTLMRGFADDLPLEAWLREAIWPAEKLWVSDDMVRDGTELAIAEMLCGGITCFSDQYWHPETVAESAVDLHIRANVGTPVIEFPTAWAESRTEYLQKGSELVHDAYADHPLITSCFAPHSSTALSDDGFIELRVLADQLDVPIQIHLHETAVEIQNSLEKTGMRPFERLNKLGLVNASLLAVHAVHMNDNEIATMVESSVSIAHCPKSNLKLASGIAPVSAYRSAGVTVGLGTDGAASNNTLDMLSEMRTAALLSKTSADDAAALSATSALSMATFDSAASLGLADNIGSIEAGKWADLTCVDLSPLHSQPVYDPVSQLVYTARAEQVSDVWVAGRHQLENGALTHIDTGSIRARANEWRQRFSKDTI